MRIILDGCDGTGKTTLAKILADHYKLDIAHCSYHDPTDFEFYSQTLRKNNIIWDRHFISELVYPEVFNRKPMLTLEQARAIADEAKSLRVRIYILVTDEEAIRQRCEARGTEEKEVLERYAYINERFRFYAKELQIPIINTNYLSLSQIYNLAEE